MKRKSLFAGLLIGILCISLLAGCGGGGSRADSKYEGKYISVMGEMLGIAMTGEDMDGFALELLSGGKANMTMDGDTESIKWSNDDTSITLKISGEEVVGEIGTDTIKFINLLGTGMDLTFAKEGTDAAKPEHYLPEKDKFMIGKWQSYKVSDVLGDDLSSVVPPEYLNIEFTADHKALMTIEGQAVEPLTWSLLGEFGSFEEEDDFTFDIVGEEIEFTIVSDEDYFVFTCKKIQ